MSELVRKTFLDALRLGDTPLQQLKGNQRGFQSRADWGVVRGLGKQSRLLTFMIDLNRGVFGRRVGRKDCKNAIQKGFFQRVDARGSSTALHFQPFGGRDRTHGSCMGKRYNSIKGITKGEQMDKFGQGGKTRKRRGGEKGDRSE